MGAWFRFFENRIERELEAGKVKGVLETPPAAGGVPLALSNGSAAAAPATGGATTAAANGSTTDLRPLIPALGLREYWYPALPASKVGRKPLFWIMLGDEMVFFRDQQGEVVALTDVCPHRGASLAEGDCFYQGFVTCPYHGACFDGRGECTAFLTEGPDSKMCGELRARAYPTRTLRGWVFVWMGAGEPAPIEEDVPPELFEPDTTVFLTSYSYWYTNWLVAIENQNDAHNCFFVHRNSFKQLTGIHMGRARTPVGPRSKVVNDRAVIAVGTNRSYYAKDGKRAVPDVLPGGERRVAAAPLAAALAVVLPAVHQAQAQVRHARGMEQRPPPAVRGPGELRVKHVHALRGPRAAEPVAHHLLPQHASEQPARTHLRARAFLCVPQLGAEPQLQRPGQRRGVPLPVLHARVLVAHRLAPR